MSLPSKGKLIALDLGLKKTGVSVTDEDQRVAFLRDQIHSDTLEGMIRLISNFILEENAAALIFGFPYSLSSDTSSQMQVVDEMIEKIMKSNELPFIKMDERLTTVMAKNRNTDVPDSEAARILLETYLDSKKSNC